jgi:hypothetical protein
MDPTKLWGGMKTPFETPDLFSKWSEMIQETIGKTAQSYDGLGPTVFFRTLGASNVFVVLNEFWTEVVKDLPELFQARGDAAKSREIYERWVAGYQKVFEQLVGSPPSDTSAEMMRSWLDIVQMRQSAYGLMWDPWIQAMPRWQEQTQKFMRGDWAALYETRSLWRETYDETLGRVFRMPAFGLNKEQTERLRKTYDGFVQFWSALPNFYRFFYDTGMAAMKDVFNKLQNLKVDELTPEAIRELYRMWWTTNEDAFFELFKKPEFCNAMGEVLNYGLRLKGRLDELTAERCEALNIPSNREIDEIAMAIQELRRKVRSQQKTIEELQSKLESPE